MNWRKALNIFKWVAAVMVALMLVVSGLLLVFKDDIKSYALEEANNYLNKRVHIGYIDVGIWKTFPNMTLSFEDVLVYSRFDTIQTIDTALYAKQIDLRFNVMNFIRGEYNVRRIDAKDVLLNLVTLEDGKINYDFLKEKEDETVTPFEFNLEKINFVNADIAYHDKSIKQYYHGFFQELELKGQFTEKQFLLDAVAKFDIKEIRNQSLVLIENQTATLDIAIQMDQINDVFEIKSADLAINKLPFTVRGKVSEEEIDFYIGAKGLNLVDVANNFTFQELNVVHEINGKGNVNFDLTIKGGREETSRMAINADFNIQNGSLSDNGFALTNINLIGKYGNGADGDKEQLNLSKIQFRSLNEDFQGNVLVTDFNQPRFQGKAKGIVDLKAVHRLFGPFDLEELSGYIGLDGHFDVRLNDPENNLKDITVNSIQSNLNLNNLTIKLINDNRKIQINNGNIAINNQNIKIKHFFVSLNNSSLNLNGEVDYIANYLSGRGNLWVKADVVSEALYIDDLSSQTEETTQARSWVLPDDINGTVDIAFKKVEYYGHTYSDIKGKMNFAKHQLNFPSVEGVTSQTYVRGGLVITEVSPMNLVIETTLNANDLKFGPLFKEWNNFEQTVITADNLQGKASVYLYLKAPFDLYEGVMDKNDLKVLTRINISDGALKNVQSFKEITKSLRNSGAKLLISKARINDFEKKLLNLQFDSFENEIKIENGIITIPNMTIKSNALDLTLSGTHTFDNDIDYAFNFRFREIKGGQQSEFGDVVDDGTGFRIFLRMFGNIDAPQFSWDKDAKKALQQERTEQSKDDFKSALKTGFGINKKDTSIQRLEDQKRREETIIMDFEEPTIEAEPEKEKKGLGKKIDKWKKEKEKEEKPVFEWD